MNKHTSQLNYTIRTTGFLWSLAHVRLCKGRVPAICLILSVLMLSSLTVFAQEKRQDRTISEVFAEMPDSLLPYLTRNNRLDLIDFVASQMEAKVTNRFDAPTTMVQLTDDFLQLQLSPSVVQQMKLLPYQHRLEAAASPSDRLPAASDSLCQVVCVVTTYSAACRHPHADSISYQVLESDIRFFTPSWQPMPCLMSIEIPSGQMMSAELSAAVPDMTIVFRSIEDAIPEETSEPGEQKQPDGFPALQSKTNEIFLKKNVNWNGKMYK